MKAVDVLLYVYWLLCTSQSGYQTIQETQQMQQHILDMYLLYMMLNKKESRTQLVSNRLFWVRPIFSRNQRLVQGASDNLVQEMAYNDRMKYFNYLRMNKRTFKKLLKQVTPYIQKQHVVREPIPPYTRLHICLRYLASGDSMQSIAFAFRVGPNTVSKIILETCGAIWQVLKAESFPKLTNQGWYNHAKSFEDKWNFRHCLGAIDGKLVTMQAPPNSGSAFYTYKKTFGINLMAVADAEYRFTIVDIGAPGRRSDGGVFRESIMGTRFESGTMSVPPPDPLEENGPILPYVLVADEAFCLSTYLMRPYPRAGVLHRKEKIFNYRLSRARRVVENAFGILGAKWRIFRSPIIGSVKLTKKIIQATTALHNWLITENLKDADEGESYSNLTAYERSLPVAGLQNFPRTNEIDEDVGPDANGFNPIRVRNKFAEYFEGTGAVAWQWRRVLMNEL